jgi:ABC-2 type transport system ATP-binding protein
VDRTDGIAVDAVGIGAGYGGTPIIRDLSLQVPRGTVYGLTGPSGAGKTTLLRVLATLHPLTAGTLHIDGVNPVKQAGAARARIGYLPDRFGGYDALTAREYLEFFASLFGVLRRRQSADELLELFGLGAAADTPVRTLSRGARQQLGMARCLVHDPTVLLLDEPAAGMDLHARLELREMLTELARLGKTVVIGSSLLSEVAEVCTHLGILLDGRMAAQGAIQEVLRNGESIEDAFLRLAGEGSTE